MSTKIYTAFRFDLADLEKFTKWAGRRMKSKTNELYSELLKHVLKEYIGDPPDHVKHSQEGIALWEKAKRAQCVSKNMRKNERGYRLIDLESGIKIYIYKNKCHAIPYGIGKVTSCLEKNKPKWVEDYCYWNNTDKPKYISYKEWNARGGVWHKILDRNNSVPELIFEIVNYDNPLGFVFELEWNNGVGDFRKWLDVQRQKEQKKRKEEF